MTRPGIEPWYTNYEANALIEPRAGAQSCAVRACRCHFVCSIKYILLFS